MTKDSKDNEIAKLKSRIQELESELTERERDLGVFRDELDIANHKLKKFIQQIAHEIKVAAQIQKALVPTEFPTIPGFEFSTKFVASMISGGDYFDIFEHEDKFRFGVVVANSTGYSMSSLFLSVLLRMSGQLEAKKGISPELILEMMAKELIPSVEAQDHANVFYAVIDRRNFELEYSNAGSFIGIHVTDQKATKLESLGEPISSHFQSGLQKKSISLNPHDKIILCTEGITKVLNPQNEKFGEERLFRSVLSKSQEDVHQLRNEIMIQVEKFAQGQEIPQDITVLVLEVKDRVIKLARK